MSTRYLRASRRLRWRQRVQVLPMDGWCLSLSIGGRTTHSVPLEPEPPSIPGIWGGADVAGQHQVRVAVVSVTTSGLVTKPPKSFRMKNSISSSRPTRSDSSIIWVTEYESISIR